jgi:hypothetical protein
MIHVLSPISFDPPYVIKRKMKFVRASSKAIAATSVASTAENAPFCAELLQIYVCVYVCVSGFFILMHV